MRHAPTIRAAKAGTGAAKTTTTDSAYRRPAALSSRYPGRRDRRPQTLPARPQEDCP
jgi:hypothetical protein